MASITYTPILDGDDATAASVNDRFTSIAAGANVLTRESLREGALNAAHLPSVANILATKKVGETFDTHNYEVQWVWNTNNAMSDPAPYTGTTWRVIKDAAPKTTALEMTAPMDFDAFVLGMTNYTNPDPGTAKVRYAGVLILLNVHFVWGGVDSFDAETVATDLVNAVTGIQIQVHGDGNWYTIKRATRLCEQRLSKRFLPTGAVPPTPVGDGTYQDIPTRLLLIEQDLLDLGLDAKKAIVGIRAVGARYRVATPDKACSVTFREGRLTALRIRAAGIPEGVP